MLTNTLLDILWSSVHALLYQTRQCHPRIKVIEIIFVIFCQLRFVSCGS